MSTFIREPVRTTLDFSTFSYIFPTPIIFKINREILSPPLCLQHFHELRHKIYFPQANFLFIHFHLSIQTLQKSLAESTFSPSHSFFSTFIFLHLSKPYLHLYSYPISYPIIISQNPISKKHILLKNTLQKFLKQEVHTGTYQPQEN